MGVIQNQIRKLYLSLRSFVETYKYGGFKTANISYLSEGNILNDKHVIVTGGASGIGYAIAHKMLNQGAVVLICGRNEKKLEEAKKSLNSNKLFTMIWDITNVDLYEEYLKEARRILNDKVDILVNNAGIAPAEFFPNVGQEEWDKIYNTNSRGTFFMCQLFYNYWKKESNKQIRKIINISSQGAYVGATYPYRMTKWDIAGLTQGLGLRMSKDNIIVNGIAPGVIKTAMQENTLKQGDNIFNKSNSLQRYAFPDEIGELSVYLASDLSNFIVGQTIVIDGGYSLK